MILFSIWDKTYIKECGYVSLIPIVNLGVSGILLFIKMAEKGIEFMESDFGIKNNFIEKIYSKIRSFIRQKEEW